MNTNKISGTLARACLLLTFLFFGKTSSTAQCPGVTPPGSTPPNGIVTLSILSIKPNSDLEGDDDYVPFYDNHADIFGKITIDGHAFDLPEVSESDFPHWDTTFSQHVTTNPVTIRITILENDSGLTGANDEVDINPDPNSKSLVFEFDLCAMTVMINGSLMGVQAPIEIKAGNGGEQATIRFKIGTDDGRPISTNDLALVESDIVQVLFQSPKLISGKPTIVMARIANNFTTTINTNVRVIVSGAGVNRNDVFPLTIGAGEVKKEYYYLNNPIRFPANNGPQQVAVHVSVEDSQNPVKDPKHCTHVNDGSPNRLIWKVVQTPLRYEMLWAKVGTLLDGFNFATDQQLEDNMQLGSAYIHGVYPLSSPYNHKAPIGILPPTTAAVNFLTTILSVFGIPADNVLPFALVFELNGVANILMTERLMGVLPDKDWFKRFSYGMFDEVTGLSLGEWAPRAVIFLPQYGEPNNLGPAITLPAHELGHTFGLSTDPTIKDSWICDVDWPILGHTACGFADGFDEYTSTLHPKGNPSNGFWIAQGNEHASISGLLNQEQCNSFCFMGGSPANAHLDWPNRMKWIDPADYDHLVNKLQLKPDPEIIFVSGIISHDDRMMFGSVQHIGDGIPDRDSLEGTYAIQLMDEYGKTIKEVGLPVKWSSTDFHDRPRPATFFALNIEYKPGTRQIQVINRMSGKVLGTKKVSRNKPVVKIKLRSDAIGRGENAEVIWSAKDADHDKLQFFTMARPAREEGWFPISHWERGKSTIFPTLGLEPGTYIVRVMASDGVHVSPSNEIQLTIR